MKRDRIATVLHLRELVERRRLAEKATAMRAVESAVLRRDTAAAERIAIALPAGQSVGPAQLLAPRLSGLALGELVERAELDRQAASRESELAEQRRVAAAVERRSVERLGERRAAASRHEIEKRDRRRSDEIALRIWRRSP